ncbi:MAG: alanine racemase [Clostridiales bacterium]|nr:alanine racemase [Clostridiales bacterium]
MNSFLKRTWAEIDLNAIAHNYRAIRQSVPLHSKMMCVIKADAYGHGAQWIAKEYERLGADWFAVSNFAEALQLRNAGVTTPILILGYTPVEMAKELSEYHISQAVFSEDYAKHLSYHAQKSGVTVRIHIKLDTGMTRIGLMCQDDIQCAQAVDAAERIAKMDSFVPEGIFTHFAVADEAEDGEAYTLTQFHCFNQAVEELERRGLHIPLRHCSNSGACLDYPQMSLDMVRCGIILYGLMPSSKIRNQIDLHPAMQLKSIVSLLKTVESGAAVSYGRTYHTKDAAQIATVPIGYADGYSRNLSDRAQMLVHGRRAPIVGRICMDQLMLDVSSIKGVREGDIVTVFGTDHGSTISVEELSSLCGTINYETICLIGKRVPRIYYRDGKMVGELDYICP